MREIASSLSFSVFLHDYRLFICVNKTTTTKMKFIPIKQFVRSLLVYVSLFSIFFLKLLLIILLCGCCDCGRENLHIYINHMIDLISLFFGNNNNNINKQTYNITRVV